MESWRLDFPPITDPDMVFGGYPEKWFDKTLAVQKDVAWSNKAGDLFFRGGSVEVNKSLPEEYVRNGLRMLKCVLASFAPKHEHKEHVAGLILKSLCEKEEA